MKALTRFIISALPVIGVAVFAGGRDLPQVRHSDYAELTKVPEKAKAKKNPFANDPDAVAAGGKLYEEHCAQCHGEKGGGTRHGASLLRDEVQQATPGTLFWVITNGVVRKGMPVWSKLPEPERWQLVTFLQSLKLRSANHPDSKINKEAKSKTIP